MNEHTIRLKAKALCAIEEYEIGLLTENGLEQILLGIASATEDKDVARHLSKLSSVIQDSLHLFDEDEGKEYLAQEISNFKKLFY